MASATGSSYRCKAMSNRFIKEESWAKARRSKRVVTTPHLLNFRTMRISGVHRYLIRHVSGKPTLSGSDPVNDLQCSDRSFADSGGDLPMLFDAPVHRLPVCISPKRESSSTGRRVAQVPVASVNSESEIASLGHCSTQTPQPLHLSGLITGFVFLKTTACSGQLSAQIPQPAHISSLITAILRRLFSLTVS
jgi:hypothetical protein